MAESMPTTKLVRYLLVVVLAMFGFGFALVPLYEVMCQAFGINGKTAGVYQGQQQVDEQRNVRVQFLATNAAGMVWQFEPVSDVVSVHPGQAMEVRYIAYNPTDKPMVAQAVPSVAPSRAAAFFHKTECFCFTQQALQPGERIEMPVRFIVDRELPADVRQLTLAYTLFDITDRTAPAKLAGR